MSSFYEFGVYLPFRIFRVCVYRQGHTTILALRWHDIAGDSEKLASHLAEAHVMKSFSFNNPKIRTMESITWAYKAQHMNRECVSPGSGNTGITTRTLLSERGQVD